MVLQKLRRHLPQLEVDLHLPLLRRRWRILRRGRRRGSGSGGRAHGSGSGSGNDVLWGSILWAALAGAEPSSLSALENLDPEAPLLILYTSGTTGPSKGVLSSYAHLTATGEALPLGPEDRYMANLPLFHVGGTLPCHTMLARGGSFSMIESFRTETFWDMIRETETTFVILLGVMAQFLAKQPPSPGDADNPLRLVCLIPYDFDATEFSARATAQTSAPSESASARYPQCRTAATPTATGLARVATGVSRDGHG